MLVKLDPLLYLDTAMWAKAKLVWGKRAGGSGCKEFGHKRNVAFHLVMFCNVTQSRRNSNCFVWGNVRRAGKM